MAASWGQRETAAAGTAEGALGLDRPAASGSRWRRNAAPQDFSRSAEARRISGWAADSGDGEATEAIRARTAASMAPARTVPASAVSPDGLAASWIRSRSSPVSMASRPPSSVTMSGPPVELLLAYALGKPGHAGQQPVHVGLVVVVHQAGPDGAA